MRLRSYSLLLVILLSASALSACGGAGAGSGPVNTAGAGMASGASSGSGSGGNGQGGTLGGTGGMTPSGGTAAGGGGASAGTAGASAGTAGANTGGGGASGGAGGSTGGAGSGGGGGARSALCPPGPFAMNPVPSGVNAQRVAGVPPADAFNNNGNDFGIVEGPVWIADALYISEFGSGATPPSRILKVTSTGQVSIAIANAGTNGLALDAAGALLGANHNAGAVQRLSLSGGAPVDLVTTYMGQRFNGPNDLTLRADGNLYFTDPDYQAPNPRPQSATRVYRVAPGATQATAIVENRQQPNGIALSLDGTRLYVSAQDGIFSHPVAADGSVGAGERFSSVSSSDGFGMDCAGNLYTTTGMAVIVLSPAGMELGRIAVPGQTTNVAFGGPEQKTLYITSLGTGMQRGLFRVDVPIPGLPY